MSTASIPPNNLLLLAGLGIAAYWFATRANGATVRRTGSASGATWTPAQQQQYQQYQANDNSLWNQVGKLLGGAVSKYNPTKDNPNAYQQANGANSGPGGQSSPTGDPYNTGYSSTNDNVAANPPGFSSVYDYSNEYWY